MKNDTYIFPQSNHAQNQGGFDANTGVNNYNEYLDRINLENQRQQMMAERLKVVNLQQHLDSVREIAVEKYLDGVKSKGLIALFNLAQKTFTASSNSQNPSKKLQIRNKFLEAESTLAGSAFVTNDNFSHHFYYYDNNEWFWYNHTKDPNIVPVQRNVIRYYVDLKHGIFKSENGSEFKPVSGLEHQRFIAATDTYAEIVMKHIYKTDSNK